MKVLYIVPVEVSGGELVAGWWADGTTAAVRVKELKACSPHSWIATILDGQGERVIKLVIGPGSIASDLRSELEVRLDRKTRYGWVVTPIDPEQPGPYERAEHDLSLRGWTPGVEVYDRTDPSRPVVVRLERRMRAMEIGAGGESIWVQLLPADPSWDRGELGWLVHRRLGRSDQLVFCGDDVLFPSPE